MDKEALLDMDLPEELKEDILALYELQKVVKVRNDTMDIIRMKMQWQHTMATLKCCISNRTISPSFAEEIREVFSSYE